MTVTEMENKFANDSDVESVDLTGITGGGSPDDFVRDDIYVKIVPASLKGKKPKRFGKRAAFIICEEVDEKGVSKNNAVQVYVSMFDRVATPYKKLADGTVARDTDKATVRAEGSAVKAWKAAANAKQFVENNMDKIIHFTLEDTVSVREWDNTLNDGKGGYSETKLRDQKVYKSEFHVPTAG